MLREVDVAKLSVGMYVADLDRPWLETPFPVQGFYIRSQEDVVRLSEFCDVVFVDPRRHDSRMQGRSRRASGWSTRIDRNGRVRRFKEHRVPTMRVHYEDQSTVDDELPSAQLALETSGYALKRFWDEISAKRKVPLAEIKLAIDPLVESILRNKDALVALMRVQRADEHTHEHCLAMAIWSGLLGRQLGLPPEDIKKMALGCSLMDIGKSRLPKAVLEQEDSLDASSCKTLQSHVQHSLDMVAEMGGADDVVQSIIMGHHERLDGSGYPQGISGAAIPMYARIAGIVDAYDEMISPRTTAATRSSFEAMTELQDLCPEKFQRELVEQFAQAVGIFPNGSLVELNTGEVAVVFSQSTGRRLRPKVLLILDAEKRHRDHLVVVDLSAESERALRISRELPHGEHGINAREYFL